MGDYYFISNIFEGGALIEMGGLFNLAKKMVSILHKELECIVEKLKYKKLEVMQMQCFQNQPSAVAFDGNFLICDAYFPFGKLDDK